MTEAVLYICRAAVGEQCVVFGGPVACVLARGVYAAAATGSSLTGRGSAFDSG